MPDKKSLIIVRLNWVDVFSLLGLVLVLTSIVRSMERDFPLALAFLFTGTMVDAFDGVFARRFGTERSFGRYLDGFIDAVSYLVAPGIFLYIWGFNRPEHMICLAVFIICGILRLSVFNDVGNIEENNKLSYLGMPVFWMHFITAGFYLLSLFVAWRMPLYLALMAVLLVYSFLMLLNRSFYKPQNKIVMFVVIAGLAIFFFYLGSVQG